MTTAKLQRAAEIAPDPERRALLARRLAGEPVTDVLRPGPLTPAEKAVVRQHVYDATSGVLALALGVDAESVHHYMTAERRRIKEATRVPPDERLATLGDDAVATLVRWHRVALEHLGGECIDRHATSSLFETWLIPRSDVSLQQMSSSAPIARVVSELRAIVQRQQRASLGDVWERVHVVQAASLLLPSSHWAVPFEWWLTPPGRLCLDALLVTDPQVLITHGELVNDFRVDRAVILEAAGAGSLHPVPDLLRRFVRGRPARAYWREEALQWLAKKGKRAPAPA